MSNIEKPRRQYHGPFGYEGETKKDELVQLGFYLLGKPDTPGWRKIFAENRMEPIVYNGRIYPEWALRDYYQLVEEDPGIKEIIFKRENLSESVIPPRESVKSVLQK